MRGKNGLNNGGNCYVLFRVCYLYRKKTIDLFDTRNYHKKSNLKYKERASFFHFRGLIMPMCRSPPFFCLKTQIKK